MRTLILLISLPVLFLSQFEANCQIDTFSKITIGKKETKIIINDKVVIDTLIMDDRATIALKSNAHLLIKHAYLGEKVSILAEGLDGSNANSYGKPGENGGDGFNVRLEINFETLGSLTVSTRGGKGGNAKSSRNRTHPNDVSVSVDQYGTVTTRRKTVKSTPTGGKAGNGGNGGKGGDLTIRYSTSGFIPTFNGSLNTKEVKNRNQSINILIEGGEKGLPGQGGGRSIGSYGTLGENGVLKIERIE